MTLFQTICAAIGLLVIFILAFLVLFTGIIFTLVAIEEHQERKEMKELYRKKLYGEE